ncbi:MAG: biotin/lipoyl-containing protein, partial [Hyphomonadaceae bacterium]
QLIAAAKKTGAEASHPGYGFLSENPDFAEAVIEAGLIWIGPTPDSIRAMGLKDEAKRIAEEAGVPVVPGYRGEAQDAKTLGAAAKEIGFPVLIKAVAGGGGRGIREVTRAGEFADALASAQREAAAAFGDDRVIVEKLIAKPRHIEVQVFGDKHGNLVHLFERDCSLQRRRQKVIEEAPAPGMTDEVRAAMTDAALKVARAVKYENAGTVEYVVDGTGALRTDGFFFLEMNTRLQVEHPVTEAVTGLDLVEWQFRVAAGEKLPKKQSEIELNGHAIEARLCAEDPAEGFRPSVGRLRMLRPRYERPRFDAGFDEGDAISSSYDSLIGKLIRSNNEQLADDPDRDICRRMLAHDLECIRVLGVSTNASYMLRAITTPAFERGEFHTGFLGDRHDEFTDKKDLRRIAAIALALKDASEAALTSDPWRASDGWRSAAPSTMLWRFEQDDESVDVVLEQTKTGWETLLGGARVGVRLQPPYRDGPHQIHLASDDARPLFFECGGVERVVFLQGEAFTFEPLGASREHADGAGGDAVKAPLPGKVVAVSAKAGARVKKGEALVTLEAMKMEHALKAPRDGVIAEIAVSAGAQVKEGALLVRLEEEAA